MIYNVIRKVSLFYNSLDIYRIIHLYRYITFFIISLFFVVSETIQSPVRKLIIVVFMGVACVLVNHLYLKYMGNSQKVIILLIMETFFNALILIPSGGLSSPYIWYSLNTIIIASVVLRRRFYCWLNLFIYLFSSIWVFSILHDNFFLIIEKEVNFILSLILITGVVQVLTEYNNRMQEKNSYLQNVNNEILLANKKIKESMNNIMELYQSVYLMTTHQDEENFQQLLLEYAKKMTGCGTVFFIREGELHAFTESLLKNPEHELVEAANKINENSTFDICSIGNRRFVLSPVKSPCKLYGVIGMELIQAHKEDKEITDQLTFLSELGTIVLEKFELENVNRNLLIDEEQNRIANEIHDCVLQNLFSTSCGIYSLMKRITSLSKNNIINELSTIRSTLNTTMSDLRTTIYGYSWNKEGVNRFLCDINNYVETIRKYHGVNIRFNLEGNHELLSINQKRSIYRIISEASGNGIKHGKAKNIAVTLHIELREACLKIMDDGTGFDKTSVEKEKKLGLGIHNIQLLSHSLDGNLQIDSEIGRGTTVMVCFPLELKSITYREEVI